MKKQMNIFRTIVDTVEVSEEGKALLEDNINSENLQSPEVKTSVDMKPATYTKMGQVSKPDEGASISVSI